jgi:GNAT superfamily N-acetyltransferase
MKQLTVSITRRFTPEMECLRRSGLHVPAGAGTSADEFDAHSVHVMADLDGVFAGMVRMTPEPPSVLQSWFHGKAPLPTGVGVVDANRSVVSEKFRGLGIYKVLMLEALTWAQAEDFTHVVAAINQRSLFAF